MSRINSDWLRSFQEFTSGTEAPGLMRFWAGVGAVSGALRRKVWIDMKRFTWTPNFFIIFVAPPGVVSKSTTADLSMDLLKQVPGINFGPDVVTWPALVTAFAQASESFEYKDEYHPMSALTLVASELGNLIDMQNKDMINLFINLWDGRKSLEKVTKMSGCDTIEAPWINMLGCTTPHWIADNINAAAVGGGFTSRCVFVYADHKEQFIAYPDEHVSECYEAQRANLIHDLEHIATNLTGPYTISEDARKWGRKWYEDLWTHRPEHLTEECFSGYIARKQTHMHKLAIILAASQRDSLVITEEDIQLADYMLVQTEKDAGKVFSKVGRTDQSMNAERFLTVVERLQTCTYTAAYREMHTLFPDFRDFEGIVSGAIRAGFIGLSQQGNEFVFKWAGLPIPKGIRF